MSAYPYIPGVFVPAPEPDMPLIPMKSLGVWEGVFRTEPHDAPSWTVSGIFASRGNMCFDGAALPEGMLRSAIEGGVRNWYFRLDNAWLTGGYALCAGDYIFSVLTDHPEVAMFKFRISVPDFYPALYRSKQDA